MKHIFFYLLMIVSIASEAQPPLHLPGKLKPIEQKQVTSQGEYLEFKDTIEKFFKDRVFVPVLVGPDDSVINKNNFPLMVSVASSSIKRDGKEVEENGLALIGSLFDRVLKSYRQFTTVTLTTRLTSETETKDFITPYYLQPAKEENELIRIAVYCKEKRKWTGIKLYKPWVEMK